MENQFQSNPGGLYESDVNARFQVVVVVDHHARCGLEFLSGFHDVLPLREKADLTVLTPASAALVADGGSVLDALVVVDTPGNMLAPPNIPAVFSYGVDFFGNLHLDSGAQVCPEAMALAVCRHIADAGYDQLAYYGAQLPELVSYLRDHCQDLGLQFLPSGSTRRSGPTSFGQADEMKRLLNWLRGLPDGTGVFVPVQKDAMELVYLCRLARIRVPDHIGLLTAGCVEPVQESLFSLSYVRVPYADMGRRVGRAILDLCAGSRQPPGRERLQELTVVGRRTTSRIRAGDPELTRIMRFLRDRALSLMTPSDICKALELPGHAVNRYLKKGTGCTLIDYLQKEKIAHAKCLLAQTDWSVGRIALVCGFNNPEYFCAVFRQKTGRTALQFRRLHTEGDAREECGGLEL